MVTERWPQNISGTDFIRPAGQSPASPTARIASRGASITSTDSSVALIDATTPAPSAPSLERLRLIWSRLLALEEPSPEEEQEPDEVTPSHATLVRAWNVLDGAIRRMTSTLPIAAASDNGCGDLYIYWKRPERDVQLIVPADANRGPMIFRGEGSDTHLEPNVTPDDVGRWLDWFSGA